MIVKKIKSGFQTAKFFLKLTIARSISIPLHMLPGYKNIWLISERGDDARDNGYHFFRYVCKNHPEINIYYVIRYDSVDYKKVAELGKTVKYNSFRHFILSSIADVNISTHAWGGDMPYIYYFQKYKIKRKSKLFIFLQHGITKDFLPSLMYPFIQPDLFVCGAKPEYEFIKNNFRHPEGVVQYTGFARYDNLIETVREDQILIMPTFRKWLQKMDKDKFIETNYFTIWNNILKSEKLNSVLEKSGVKLVFYPHYEMQKFLECFKSNQEHIIIADFDNYDVQDLLIKSKLLITDFSSVFFDFGYMKKPVIYYQFDRNEYIKKHYDYTKGYFSYDDNSFGEVVYDEQALISTISKYIDKEFTLDEKYRNRIDTFFEFHDQNNCLRIYNQINRLLNTGE